MIHSFIRIIFWNNKEKGVTRADREEGKSSTERAEKIDKTKKIKPGEWEQVKILVFRAIHVTKYQNK